jgi:hypothetical protein
MWGPLITMIAGALSDSREADEKRSQAAADQHMNYAMRLNPRIDPAAYNAEKFNRDLEEAQRQAFTKRLGDFLKSSLMEKKKPTDEDKDAFMKRSEHVADQWRAQDSASDPWMRSPSLPLRGL